MTDLIKLENGDLVNMYQIVHVFKSNGMYWVKTTVHDFAISETDFNNLKGLSL